VLAWDNGPGVSDTESEHTARYQDLLILNRSNRENKSIADPLRIGLGLVHTQQERMNRRG